VQCSPAQRRLVGFACVQTDLQAGRAAHHPRAVRAELREGALHRGVPGNGQDAVGRAEGVEAELTWCQAFGGE
jgi:hypothetical protein